MNGSAAMAGIADIVAPGTRIPSWCATGAGSRSSARWGAALLIKDLGRPERFLNMLRILKLKSPMSVGVWAVMAMSVSAGINAMDQLDRDEGCRRRCTASSGSSAPSCRGRCAERCSASRRRSPPRTSACCCRRPRSRVWYRGRWFIPPLFVLSGATTSCALHAALLALRGDCEKTVAKLEKIEALPLLARRTRVPACLRAQRGRRRQDAVRGETGRRLKQMTMIGGLIVPLVALQLPGLLRRGVHKPNPVRALAGAALTLTGGWVLRDSMLRAGRASADDPRPVLRKAG